MKNKTKTIKKVHKKLPPHRHQAHPAVKEKDINKVFIVTVLSIFIVVVLSLLLLLSPKSVGKASFTGAEEMQAGIFVNPDDNFLVTNKSSSIPINVNIGTNKTTVFSFNITYNSLEFEVDCSNVFDILDEKFGYVDEANPGLVFIREAKCGFLGRVEFNFAALPSETAYITANEIIANLKVTPIGIGGGKEFNFNKFDVYSLDDGNKINLDISDATFTFILEGGEVIAPFADLVIVRGIGDDKKFWISESIGNSFEAPASVGVVDNINYASYTIHTGDFNGDDIDEIALLNKSGPNITFQVSDGINNPYFSTSINGFPPYESTDYIGDFNGDGKDDFLLMRENEFDNSNTNFYLAESTGSSFSDLTYVGAVLDIIGYDNLFIGDFDGDGDDGIAINFFDVEQNLYLWKKINYVDGVFVLDIQWNDALGVNGDQFLIGDFMSTAGEEMVVLHQDTLNNVPGVRMNRVRFNGNNSFSAPAGNTFIQNVQGENHQFYAEDFDGDGKDEIAVARINGNTVTWWVMGDTYDPFVWNFDDWITDAGNDGDQFFVGNFPYLNGFLNLETDCFDDYDNDYDDLTDCEDPDCAEISLLISEDGDEVTYSCIEHCYDNFDNNDNNLTDCEDPDCDGDSNCGSICTSGDQTTTVISPDGTINYNNYCVDATGIEVIRGPLIVKYTCGPDGNSAMELPEESCLGNEWCNSGLCLNYTDLDNDGYDIGGIKSDIIDCDDNNASVWKNHPQVYVDNDGDTYGTGGSLNICAGETLIGYSNKASDCDDNNSQLDVCGDGLDCEDYACVVKSNSDSDCSTCVSGCDTNNTYELNYCFDKYDLCNNITCVYDYPGDSNATLRTACQANCSINNNLCTTNATTNYNTCKTSCGCTENCNNTIDDDYDSLIDCEDDSCAGNSACVTLGTDDTGTDDTSSSSSSGGGGNYCSSNWKCGTWSFCNATLKQTRTCQDLKHCKDDKVEEQNCTKCIESWTCQAWTDCSSELQSRTCVDSHLCGTTFLKPKLQRECLMPGSKGYIPPNSGNYVAPDQPEPVLPAVLQQPKQSFWQEHKIAITASGLGILLLGALIFLLIHFISKHKPAGEEDLTALKNWVKKERELGASEEQIKQTLIQQSDWKPDEIDKVI